MDRSQQYKDGYRSAVKDAIAWLHDRANEMNDPSARAALNSAAYSFGNHAKRGLEVPHHEIRDLGEFVAERRGKE